ncbi:MAG: sigma-70 family RNA polymerase sigma factor [Deltaproteobacteria bacterium]|jgi:RNA polymerase sigma-70 factor (ECF subfamily)|nr:sigma-70 family RNA polymerase sigma factor [Deltaproteobacteria bacterium]
MPVILSLPVDECSLKLRIRNYPLPSFMFKKMNNNAISSSKPINPRIWIEAYHKILFKYALARLGDADLAEESIQETFLAALQSRKGFRGLASEKTWLVSILKRKIYDHFRRMSRDRQFKMSFPKERLSNDIFDSDRLSAVKSCIWFSDPSKVYEQKEFLTIIKHSLSALPDRTAQAFILRDVIELSSQEICGFMNISIVNLYVMVHRARKRLKEDLQLKWFH